MGSTNLFNYLFTNYGTNPWTRDSMIKLINSNSSFFSTFKTSTFNNGDTIPFYLGSPCFQQKVLQRATAQQLFYALYESNTMDAINFLEQNGKFSPIFMDQLSVNCMDFLTRWDVFQL